MKWIRKSYRLIANDNNRLKALSKRTLMSENLIVIEALREYFIKDNSPKEER